MTPSSWPNPIRPTALVSASAWARALPWLVWWFSATWTMARTIEADICVYGGTSGGVAAAVTASRLGKSVVLVAVDHHIGGMSSSGLGVTDRGVIGSIGGVSREFYKRVGSVYGATERFDFEPGVAERVFRQMLAGAAVPIYTNQRLASVVEVGARLRELRMEDGSVFRTRMFIDTTYEGDLMAAVGVTYTVGRESTATYGESLGGVRVPGGAYTYDPYVMPGNPGSGLLPLMQPNTLGPPGSGDDRVQAYNFRLCLTQNATNRLPLAPPADYNEARYELAARYIAARVAADGNVTLGQLLHLQTQIPNGKTDINANGELSTDYVGGSWTWPTNTWAGRVALQREHEDYVRGLLTFLATSARVPAGVRTEMQSWGLCRDEFKATGGWPPQLYVREARRMVGDYVMRQANALGTILAPEPVGLASYAIDSHALTRVPVSGAARSEGGMFTAVPQPFPISYRSIVPRTGECENVFVTFALSASHVAFSSCRMEPVFMMTSQSAATAVAFALDDNVPVQQVSYARLALQLRADGQILDWTGGTLGTSGVMVDDGDPGTLVTGSWATGANAGGWNGDYLHDQNSGKGMKSVRYTPNLPFSGAYDVLARWVADPNRAANTPYDIVHTAGTNRVLVNQQGNGSTWVFLLRTNFTGGAGEGVILRNEGTAGFVVADAVRFMPVGAFPVPVPTVQVVTSDPRADERGDRARITLVRDGDLTGSLSVNYAMSGTASNGVDFAALLGVALFPPGSNAVALPMVPVADGLPEEDETAIVTLRAGTNYQVGALSNAVAVIRDGETLPPRFDSIQFEPPAHVLISFTAAMNRSYVLEQSDGLCPTEWSETVTIPARTNAAAVRLTNDIPPAPRQRFYRLVTP